MSLQISIPDIAEQMGCSQTYFRRLFKARTGRSPLEYLQGLRLQHAKSLLKHTSMPISEIASAVGHEDAFYFSRVFKRLSGLSPRNYRNSVENSDSS
jgi:transcriptional regulator GlxA family with amidase domain